MAKTLLKRIDFKVSDREMTVLDQYCQRTGATKMGTFRMLLFVLLDDDLLSQVRELISKRDGKL